MAIYEATVRTPWSVHEAFDYMSDLSNFDEWDPGTKQSVLVDGEPGELGSTYDLTVGGRHLHYEIVDIEEDACVVARADTSSLTSEDTITIAPATDGSVVTYRVNLRPKGLMRLAGPFLALALKRMGDRGAQGLALALQGTRIRTA